MTWKQQQRTNISWSDNYSITFNSHQNSITQINPKPTEIGSQFIAKNYNYTNLDRQAANLNYQGKSISELASLLSQYVTTDLEKARIIYAWVGYHIAYDAKGFLSGQYPSGNPEVVLINRQAVCSGYANLYHALAIEMGLEVAIIEGYAKGYGYAVGNGDQPNHAWNAVKIDGGWYLLDATWGAGTLTNEQFQPNFNSYYFATAPKQFIYDHFPSNSAWQLLSKPYNKQEFEQLPKISSQFFKYGLEIISHKTKIIETNRRVEIVLKAPEDVILSATVQQNSEVLPDNYHFIQRKNGYFIINVAFPSSGNYELTVFAKKQTDPGMYINAISYQIIANNNVASFPLNNFETFHKNKAYLYEPLVQNLPVNQSVYFKLDLPQALDVQVIDFNSQIWTPLERSGNSFQGFAPVSNGKVNIVAKFSNNAQYWTVLEYN
ncbi:transglutaminase domain-containing protein [Stanieria cyanosphaera]|uniref:transglutaminase domain-containing protein n=1 Tax=Stanieria cyanosphaera TaxID=102116 RepID=UPI001494B632|nr:transglutaminase domain-containing protein [Stanieria cyanosphaera]